jgi:hypothetical protein
MKVYRNNCGIEMTLDEFINLLEDEDRIYDLTELIGTLEDDEILRESEAALEDEEEEELHPYDSAGAVAVLEPPAINQYFINIHTQADYPEGLDDEDYLDELEELNSDELIQVRRIIKRFGSLLD